MRNGLVILALLAPVIALALPDDATYRGFLLELGTVIGTTLNIALTEPGSSIRRTKATIRAGNGGSSRGG